MIGEYKMREVNVVEIKTTRHAMEFGRDEMSFANMNRQMPMICHDNGKFVDDMVYTDERRRVVQFNTINGGKDYVVWSPEVEQLVGKPLRAIEQLETENSNLHRNHHEMERKLYQTEHDRNNLQLKLAGTRREIEQLEKKSDTWEGIASRQQARLTRMILLFGMVSIVVTACSLFGVFVS